MKIAVTTPTGHVGSTVADCLLQSRGDISVRLLGWRRNALERFIRRGAEIAIGAQDDADYLRSATANVDALLWVTPPGFGSDNVRAFQNRLGHSAAYAIRTNRIPRVVNLSSLGADLDSGAGPINGLHDVEQLLDEVADNITHLRPGFFFENLLGQFDSIRSAGQISLPTSGSRRAPMIATYDIAQVAAKRLQDPTWSGRHVMELHGAADLSLDEVAQILSQTLGRKIVFVQCNPRQFRESLLQSGMSENIADLMLEMYDAFESGRLKPTQPRSPHTTTPTTLAAFAREVMLPLISEPVTG